MVAAGSVSLLGCSDPSDAAQSSTTSTSTTASRPTAVPTTRIPAASEPPGLWVVAESGVLDESGQRYAAPVEGSEEVLRSIVDDGAGGVYYLRCPEPLATECAVEHAKEPNGEPRRLGTAVDLLAAGTRGERSVLAVAVIDPAREANQEADTGQTSGHLLDTTTGESIGTFEWYGWDTGPTALDLAGDSIVACMGRGEYCDIGASNDPAVMPTAIEGIEPDLTVSSLVLDAAGSVLAWIQLEPMDGSVVAVHRDLATGREVRDELRTSDEALPADAVTDGVWAAVRVGETVYLHELLDGTGAGTRTVPSTTSEIALRSSGAASGLNSRL